MLLYRMLLRRNLFDFGCHFIKQSKMDFKAIDFVVRHGSSNSPTKENHAKNHANPEANGHIEESYEKAITTLNTLITNAAFQQHMITQQKTSTESLNLIDTIKYMTRAGITLQDLQKLKVIHIAGTKGKGSTCALVESILRNHGFRTGFYSSPHLISVTERIRLAGLPISKESFAKYFWIIHNRLQASAEHDTDFPPYFKFLTIMCFYVFLHEEVDVAIIEVGIGGQYDCTNVIPNTRTCGITSLGLEHTQILGNTIEKIAWQKAGIIKTGSDVFTVGQPPGCVDVIEQRVKENNANFWLVPDYIDYQWSRTPNVETLEIEAQRTNASLAIQLACNWMHHYSNNSVLEESIKYEPVTYITENIVRGIERCFWPGRCQLIKYYNKNIYLDGAHTLESIQLCSTWFTKNTKESKNKKVLIFNITGMRSTSDLLTKLDENIAFDAVIFVPNISSTTSNHPDSITIDDQLVRCKQNEEIWLKIREQTASPIIEFEPITKVFLSVCDALTYLDAHFIPNPETEIDILVTGSLHLIGATLLGLEEYDKQINSDDS